jgi:hypothetical protein
MVMDINELAVTPKVKKSIDEMIDTAIVRCPSEKVVNDSDLESRNPDFCVFVLSYGRANNVKTLDTLLEDEGKFSQDYYVVCSSDDKLLPEYIEKYGDRTLVFDKEEVAKHTDLADNFDKRNIVIFARNICFSFAKKLGYRYFVDKSHVYYDNEIIEDLDPVLLEEMGNNYYRDNRNIVYSGKILDKADYETFEILDENSYSAKDKNHMYKWGRIIK